MAVAPVTVETISTVPAKAEFRDKSGDVTQKKQSSAGMTLAPVTVENISTVLSKAEFRDKFGRMFQFMALALTGLGSVTRQPVLKKTSFHVWFHLALSRRSHRFLKGFIFQNKLSQALATSAASPVEKALEVFSVAFLQVFFLIDHYAWLKQIKLLPDPATRKARGMQTVYFGIRFFFASSVFSTLIHARKLIALHQEEGERGDRWKARRTTCVKNLVKFAMRIFETAHTSKLYETHDLAVGISGVVSSAMDSLGQWPASTC